MRSFQNVIVLLFALVAFAFAAQESESYDATVYITSTVYRVNTVTLSSSPSASIANQTSTIQAPTSYVVPTASYHSANGTVIKPTGSVTKPATPEFTGAASTLNVNALVVALAAGVGYLVL